MRTIVRENRPLKTGTKTMTNPLIFMAVRPDVRLRPPAKPCGRPGVPFL
jgi:hypothetical protein